MLIEMSRGDPSNGRTVKGPKTIVCLHLEWFWLFFGEVGLQLPPVQSSYSSGEGMQAETTPPDHNKPSEVNRTIIKGVSFTSKVTERLVDLVGIEKELSLDHTITRRLLK